MTVNQSASLVVLELWIKDCFGVLYECFKCSNWFGHLLI